MTRYRLEEKFRQAEGDGGPAFLRVSATYAVDLFVGVEEGKRALLLICNREPVEPPVLVALAAHRRKREDGQWALLVSLERRDLSDLFAYLAEDLVLFAERETDCYRASARLVERLKWWQRLLSRGESGLLGNFELRGLVGELLFLRDFAIPAKGAREALEAWVGPFDAPRDFRFSQADVEVKALTRDASTIRISSAEQLELSGAPLTLATIVLEGASDRTSGAISVYQIVSEVRARCEPDADVVAALSQRLWAAGYVDRPEYESILFIFQAPSFYQCGEGFPRMTSTTLPAGVVQCTYQIDIDAISSFKVADWS